MSRIRKRSSEELPAAGGASALAGGVNNPELLTRLWQFREKFRGGKDPGKVLKGALKLACEHFGARESCIVSMPPGADAAELEFRTPQTADWDLDLLATFLRGRKIAVPHDTMFARIRRRGRMWGALVVRNTSAD